MYSSSAILRDRTLQLGLLTNSSSLDGSPLPGLNQHRVHTHGGGGVRCMGAGLGGELDVHLVDGGFLFKWVALAIPWKTYIKLIFQKLEFPLPKRQGSKSTGMLPLT